MQYLVRMSSAPAGCSSSYALPDISAPAAAVSAKLHHEVDRNNDGNSGVEAANTVTAVTENTAAVAADHYFGRNLDIATE